MSDNALCSKRSQLQAKGTSEVRNALHHCWTHGFEVAESTVSKYMTKHRGRPSQTWWTFLRTNGERQWRHRWSVRTASAFV